MGTMDRLFDGADHSYYPSWVCSSCGAKYGRRRCGIATWHGGACGICGINASVTKPRGFGHLKPGWREQYEASGEAESELSARLALRNNRRMTWN